MGRLRCEKGLLGDIRVSLETGNKHISLGSVQSWEDQEEVVRFVNQVNQQLYQVASAYVSQEGKAAILGVRG
jgi:hypothetical protein